MQATREERVVLNVEGMTCTNCAMGVTRFLEKKGLKNVHVDFTNDEANFDLNPAIEVREIIGGIRNLGYTVSAEKSHLESNGFSSVEKLFVFCLVLTLPLFLAMFLSLIHI